MKGHNVCLDLMRGVAAQAVLWSHGVAVLMVPPQAVAPRQSIAFKVLWQLSSYGQEAVAIFFVLSGFLIGHDTYLRIGSGSFVPALYTGNRLVRLYCVALPGLLLSALLGYLTLRLGSGIQVVATNGFWPDSWGDLQSFSMGTLSCNLLFLQMAECRQFGINSSLWSLSNEFFYYAMFPSLLMVLYCARPRVRLAALAVLIFFLVEIGRSGRLDMYRPIIYILGFLIWVLGAFIPELLPRLPRFLRGAAGGALCVLALVLARHFQADPLIRGFVIALFAAWLIFNSPSVNAVLSRMPGAARRLVATASNYSYSLYFMHLPFIVALMCVLSPLQAKLRYDTRGIALLFGTLATVNALCFVFYFVFERHYHRVQRWLSGSLPPSLARSSVAVVGRTRPT